MTASHHNHPPSSPELHEKHTAFLEHLLSNPQFAHAVANYTKIDDTHDIPFLGGSNNAGDTIYFDRQFADAVKAGKVLYDGKPYDPRPYIKVHEAVEGAAIRLLGANYDTDNAQGLPGGHEIATWAERRALQHDGLDWAKHTKAVEPWIRKDEHERVTNPPPDLLKVPYRGTPQDKEVEPRVAGGKPMPPQFDPMQPLQFMQVAPGGGQSGQGKPSLWDAAASAGKALAGVAGGYARNPTVEAQAPGNAMRNHALTIASATHLHRAGHLPAMQKAQIHARAKAGMQRLKAGPSMGGLPMPSGMPPVPGGMPPIGAMPSPAPPMPNFGELSPSPGGYVPNPRPDPRRAYPAADAQPTGSYDQEPWQPPEPTTEDIERARQYNTVEPFSKNRLGRVGMPVAGGLAGGALGTAAGAVAPFAAMAASPLTWLIPGAWGAAGAIAPWTAAAGGVAGGGLGAYGGYQAQLAREKAARYRALINQGIAIPDERR